MPGGVQGLDRYAYTANNPVRYVDPSGHNVDCGIGEYGCQAGVYLNDGGNPCALNDSEHICLLNNGGFIDESHYGQSEDDRTPVEQFWRDLKKAVGQTNFPIPITQSSIGGTFTGIYYVTIPEGITSEELAALGLAVWLDFQQNYEAWQSNAPFHLGNHSAFETADIPSTYLGYVSVVTGYDYSTIIKLLGGGTSSSSAPPGHGVLSGMMGNGIEECLTSSCEVSGARNDTLFLKIETSSGYVTISYPASLSITPAENWMSFITSPTEFITPPNWTLP